MGGSVTAQKDGRDMSPRLRCLDFKLRPSGVSSFLGTAFASDRAFRPTRAAGASRVVTLQTFLQESFPDGGVSRLGKEPRNESTRKLANQNFPAGKFFDHVVFPEAG